jgi:hypothetical protein
MAKVILAAMITGTRDNQDWPPVGSEVDLPDREAHGLIMSGAAVEPDHELAAGLRNSPGAVTGFKFAPPAPVESAAINDEPVSRRPGRA